MLKKGPVASPPRIAGVAVDWPGLKRGKALISGKSRRGRHAIVRVCHDVTRKGNQLKNLLRYRLLGDVAVMTGSVVLWAGYAALAAGQVPGLPSVSGITELQKPVADAVQFLCPKLPAPNPNGTLTERLSNSCTLMVVTSLVNQKQLDPNNPFNLNISDDQLKRGIQAIAPVQANAQKQISVEASKMSLVGSRLLDLRGGARGLVIGMNGQEAQQAADGHASAGASAGL